MNNSGIGTSIYYPKPVPLLKYYKNFIIKNHQIMLMLNTSDNSICLSVNLT